MDPGSLEGFGPDAATLLGRRIEQHVAKTGKPPTRVVLTPPELRRIEDQMRWCSVDMRHPTWAKDRKFMGVPIVTTEEC